jgi:hypothetical protein
MLVYTCISPSDPLTRIKILNPLVPDGDVYRALAAMEGPMAA